MGRTIGNDKLKDGLYILELEVKAMDLLRQIVSQKMVLFNNYIDGINS